MIKEKLKYMDIRITELADYLSVSRPTMYKYIDFYDTKCFEQINSKILKLFNYINDNELIGKKNVINYILTNLVDLKELGTKEEKEKINSVKKYLISNPDLKKSKFISICVTSDVYDDIINYLVDIHSMVKKKKLTAEENEKLLLYKEIVLRLSSRKENTK